MAHNEVSHIWTEDDNHALSVAHLDVLTYAEAFYLYYDSLRKRSRWFRIPIISLSALTSGASFAFSTFPSKWQVYFQVGVGVASLIVTILSGLEGYFRLAALTNQTEKTIIELAALSQETYAKTKMRDIERGTPGDTIKTVYMKLSTILNGSAIVPAEFIAKNFRKLHFGVISSLFAKNAALAVLHQKTEQGLMSGDINPKKHLFDMYITKLPKVQQLLLERKQLNENHIREIVDKELKDAKEHLYNTHNSQMIPTNMRTNQAYEDVI